MFDGTRTVHTSEMILRVNAHSAQRYLLFVCETKFNALSDAARCFAGPRRWDTLRAASRLACRTWKRWRDRQRPRPSSTASRSLRKQGCRQQRAPPPVCTACGRRGIANPLADVPYVTPKGGACVPGQRGRAHRFWHQHVQAWVAAGSCASSSVLVRAAGGAAQQHNVLECYIGTALWQFDACGNSMR